jgi:hypothetical protein
MGINLPDMEMPISCAKCKLFGEYGCPFIGAVGYALTRGKRNEDCPLVPVPPHGRLIDADANLSVFRRVLDNPYTDHGKIDTAMLKACIKTFEEAPTIIPESEEVYDKYTDTAGNLHWTGTHSGKHIVKAEEGE